MKRLHYPIECRSSLRGTTHENPWQTIVQPTIEDILHTSQVPGMVIALTKEDGPVEHLVLGTDGKARCKVYRSWPGGTIRERNVHATKGASHERS